VAFATSKVVSKDLPIVFIGNSSRYNSVASVRLVIDS